MIVNEGIARLVYLLAGLLIWGAHLTLIYGFTALACARRFADARIFAIGPIPLFVMATTVIAVIALAFVLHRAIPRSSAPEDSLGNGSFTSYVAATGAVLALVAVLWQAVPILMLPYCS